MSASLLERTTGLLLLLFGTMASGTTASEANDSITGGNTAKRSSAVFPVRVNTLVRILIQ